MDQPVTRARTRWRVTGKVICACRLMANRRTWTYTAMEVERSGTFVPSVDQPAVLTAILKDQNLEALRRFGGAEAVAAALGSDPVTGISDKRQVAQLREEFGPNTFAAVTRRKPFPRLVADSLLGVIPAILLICAIISLGIGIKQRASWHESCAIFAAVLARAIFLAVVEFQKAGMYEELFKQGREIFVIAIRQGWRLPISASDLVVGDVVLLHVGDQIPADGLFLRGYNLTVDESRMTGEREPVKIVSENQPFLLSGTMVSDGYATMVVTAVGMSTEWGRMMSSVMDNRETLMQERLGKVVACIGKVGITFASLVLVVMLVRYFTKDAKKKDGLIVLREVVGIIAVAAAMLVVATLKGLLFNHDLALIRSLNRAPVIVRNLSACENMRCARVICINKTGMLRMNQMEVSKFLVGCDFVQENRSGTLLAPELRRLICQGVGLNTSGSVYASHSGPEISGSATEKAILSWGCADLGMDTTKLRSDYEILRFEPFVLHRSGVLVREIGGNTVCQHLKGAAEIVLPMCTNYYEANGAVKHLDESQSCNISRLIEGMASSGLRCIAFAHLDLPEEDSKDRPWLGETGLTLLGIVGIKDPCRPGVKEAVEACKSAGVSIKLITAENVFSARALAVECGILVPQGEQNAGQVVEGTEFRNYTDEQRMKKIDNICVMGRSSPLDKLLMVQCLKRNGHVVAVTGHGANDPPALIEADVGLSMAIHGTEAAKQSSDVVISDGGFVSVVSFLRLGRSVYENLQKLIQFELMVSVASVAINFIGAVSVGEVPLTAVQLLWVNLVVVALGALSQVTAQPSHGPHRPMSQADPLITSAMWRNVLAQSAYQIALILLLQFTGESVFRVSVERKRAMVFNAFVLCQVFNVFPLVGRNWRVMGIAGLTVGIQILLVEVRFFNNFADTTSLNLLQWLVCVFSAAFTLPLGWFVKSIPVSDRFLNKIKEAVISAIVSAVFTVFVTVLYNLHKSYHTKH